MNLRLKLGHTVAWREALEPLLGLWSVIVATQEELRQLWGTDDPQELFDTGLLYAGQILVVKRSPRGAFAQWRDHRIDVSGVQVESWTPWEPATDSRPASSPPV